MRATAIACLVVITGAHAGAGAEEPPSRPSVSVVVLADEESRRSIWAQLHQSDELPVDLLPVQPPNVPPVRESETDLEERLAAARAHYEPAAFEECLQLTRDDAELHSLLAAGRADTAARMLFWRIACLVGSGDTVAAEREAARFATLELPVPQDVDAASAEVAAVLSRVRAAVMERPRIPARVTSNVTGATVSVDGRASLCVTPCPIDLPPGTHVVTADAPGYTQTLRLVELPGDESIVIRLRAASPDLAAMQWTRLRASGAAVDSDESLQVLSRAVRARRTALLVVDRARVRATLAMDGAVRARAERSNVVRSDLPAETVEVMRELLVTGGIVEPAPGLVERPLFWIAVVGAALLAAGVTAWIAYEPDRQSDLSF